MGKSNNLIGELEEVDCETMTVVYENCGVYKEFKAPKDEAISFVQKILANPEEMKFLEIQYIRAAK